MKGIAAWIWIVSSVLLGIIIVVLGSKLIINQIQVQEKHDILKQTDTFFKKLEDVCIKGGLGEMYGLQMTIPDITKAIYLGNDAEEFPPDKVSVYISEGASAIGSYLCFQFFDENIPRCLKLHCQSNMTYIGTPSLKLDLSTNIARILSRLSGTSPVYKYHIVINKTDDNFLTVNATQIIK
jgi:hypothetical protein